MRKSIYLLNVLFIILLSACKQEIQLNTKTIEKTEQMAVVLNKNSSVRIQPYIHSSKIFSLKRGSRVDIIEKSIGSNVIATKKDYWYRVTLPDGSSGWTFGTNLKVFDKNQASSMDNFEQTLKSEEIEAIQKDLVGKWWSINKNGDFTSHMIKIYKDGKYKSQKKYKRLMSGELELDPIKETITFSKGSSVGKTIYYVLRGDEYFLEYHGKNDYTFSFKKISSEPDSEEENIHTVDETE